MFIGLFSTMASAANSPASTIYFKDPVGNGTMHLPLDQLFSCFLNQS